MIGRLLPAADRAGVDTSPPVIGEFPLDLCESFPIAVHLPVTGSVPIPTIEGARPHVVPGGRFSAGTHVRPHRTLALTYWDLLANGQGPGTAEAGSRYVLERYLDDPHKTPDSKIRTEVLLPLTTVGTNQRELPPSRSTPDS